MTTGASLKRGQWSVEELTKLRGSYGRRPLTQLARELRRTEQTVQQRARQLFLGRLRVGELTAAERAELRLMVGVADLETMAMVLGREEGAVLRELRSWAEVRRKGRFEPWEVDYLKACYASRADWAVVFVLGRQAAVVRRRARDLGLGKDRNVESVRVAELEKVVAMRPQPAVQMPRWSSEETSVLRRTYPTAANLEIARTLGRSVKSVIAKANELGLHKSPERLETMGRENVRRRHRRG